MENENINIRARYIFIENYGNRELMRDNNYLEEYDSYSIPRKTEIIWKSEFINEQFLKAETKEISISDLISSLCGMINSFREVSDFERLLQIHKKYLSQADLFLQSRYFDACYEALIVLVGFENNMPHDSRLGLINKLSCMVIDTIREKGNKTNEIYKGITSRYGLEYKENYLDVRLERIIENLSRLRGFLDKDGISNKV